MGFTLFRYNKSESSFDNIVIGSADIFPLFNPAIYSQSSPPFANTYKKVSITCTDGGYGINV